MEDQIKGYDINSYRKFIKSNVPLTRKWLKIWEKKLQNFYDHKEVVLINTDPDEVAILEVFIDVLWKDLVDTWKKRIKKCKAIIRFAENENRELIDLEYIKENVNMEKVLDYYGIEYRNGMACCPFHDDKMPSFSIKGKGSRLWYCFAGCGGGSVIDFVMKKENCDFKTAINILQRLI